MTLPSRLSMLWVGLAALAVAAGTEVYLQANRVGTSNRDLTSHPASAEESMPESSPPTGMDEAQREYLWDIEHYGNLFSPGPYGFLALGEALAQCGQEQLCNFVANRFV